MGRLLKEMETAAGRKRKLGESEYSSIQLKTRRLAAENALEASKFADLELDYEATVDSLDCGERRESTPLREAGELESTATPPEKNPRRRSATVKLPSEADLEEFFSTAEKSIQKEFINKYNFDIVKDEPLEGRYEWVNVEVKILTV